MHKNAVAGESKQTNIGEKKLIVLYMPAMQDIKAGFWKCKHVDEYTSTWYGTIVTMLSRLSK